MTAPIRRYLDVRVLTVAVALAGCGPPAEPPAREVVRAVKTEVFGKSPAESEYSYPGKVYANQTVDVAFEVPGKLTELPVTKGQVVSPGDLLARLDQRDFANELDQALAVKAEAEATLGRFNKAYEKRAVSKQELDEAASRARIATAEVQIKQKALEDSSVRAPMHGIVANRLVDNFENVLAKEPVVVLQDISRLEIRINIPEKDMASGGDETGRITAEFDVAEGREFELAVKEFVTDADPVTQTFAITLWMAAPDDVDILPGMTATVHWYPPAAGSGSAHSVPLAAVLGQPGRTAWVWVVDPETKLVSKRNVTVGPILHGDRVAIESGLEPGETVAAAGAHHLDEGMRVREYAR